MGFYQIVDIYGHYLLDLDPPQEFAFLYGT